MAKSKRLRGPTRPLSARKAEAEMKLDLLNKRVEKEILASDIRALRASLRRRRS